MTDSPEPPIKSPIRIVEKITLSGSDKEDITQEARKYAVENNYLAFDFGKATRLREKGMVKVEVSFFGRKEVD